MPLVKCAEPGCPAIIDAACPPVSILFGFKVYLEDMLTNLPEDNPLYEKTSIQLTQVNSQLQASGLQDEEFHYQAFRQTSAVQVINTEFKVNKPATVQKTFYLECPKGHRNTYIVDCPA